MCFDVIGVCDLSIFVKYIYFFTNTHIPVYRFVDSHICTLHVYTFYVMYAKWTHLMYIYMHLYNIIYVLLFYRVVYMCIYIAIYGVVNIYMYNCINVLLYNVDTGLINPLPPYTRRSRRFSIDFEVTNPPK